MKPLPCAVCGKPDTINHVCRTPLPTTKYDDNTLKCPSCGHDVKYGYIEPVKRNDVLDTVMIDIDNENWTPQKTMSDMVIRFREIIEALKD